LQTKMRDLNSTIMISWQGRAGCSWSRYSTADGIEAIANFCSTGSAATCRSMSGSEELPLRIEQERSSMEAVQTIEVPMLPPTPRQSLAQLRLSKKVADARAKSARPWVASCAQDEDIPVRLPRVGLVPDGVFDNLDIVKVVFTEGGSGQNRYREASRRHARSSLRKTKLT